MCGQMEGAAAQSSSMYGTKLIVLAKQICPDDVINDGVRKCHLMIITKNVKFCLRDFYFQIQFYMSYVQLRGFCVNKNITDKFRHDVTDKICRKSPEPNKLIS